MRRIAHVGLVVLGAVAAVALLWWGGNVTPMSAAEPLGRNELFLGFLCLGVLAIAAYGFDLREWL